MILFILSEEKLNSWICLHHVQNIKALRGKQIIEPSWTWVHDPVEPVEVSTALQAARTWSEGLPVQSAAKKCTCWRAQGQPAHLARSFISLLWFTLLWRHHLPFSHMHNNAETLILYFSLYCSPLLCPPCINSSLCSSSFSPPLHPPPPHLILLYLAPTITSDLGLKALCLPTVSRYWSSHMSVCIGTTACASVWHG